MQKMRSQPLSDLGVDTQTALKNPRRPLNIQKSLSNQGTKTPRELVSHHVLKGGIGMQAFLDLLIGLLHSAL